MCTSVLRGYIQTIYRIRMTYVVNHSRTNKARRSLAQRRLRTAVSMKDNSKAVDTMGLVDPQ